MIGRTARHTAGKEASRIINALTDGQDPARAVIVDFMGGRKPPHFAKGNNTPTLSTALTLDQIRLREFPPTHSEGPE